MKTKMRHTNNKREMKEEERTKQRKTPEGESAKCEKWWLYERGTAD